MMKNGPTSLIQSEAPANSARAESRSMTTKIAIYAICKNELKFVEKWFESMKEADYICILDTGSTDGTYEVLLEYQQKEPNKVFIGQKIITPWRFDVARNESLKLVPEDTDIYFCTDLDELLEPGWAAPLRESWIKGQHTRASYTYIWSHLDNGQPGRIFGYNKIHTKKWIWRYPVHELLWDSEKETEHCSTEEYVNLWGKIILHHYPDRTKSRSNYLPLLEMREKNYPEDCYGLIYLSHEYRYHQMWDKSIEKLYKILDKYDGVIDIIERASCYLFLGDNYRNLKQYDKAIESYKKGIEVEPTYRELYLNLAKVYLELKEYNTAIYYIKEGLAKSYRHYNWLERDISWSYEPYDLLCLAYFYNGDKLKSLGCAYKALQYFPEEERLKKNVQIVLQQMKETDW